MAMRCRRQGLRGSGDKIEKLNEEIARLDAISAELMKGEGQANLV